MVGGTALRCDPLYTATGTYSLPVMLPDGEVKLDFTTPSGGARISLWAIPKSALSNLYVSLIVIGGLLVIVGLVKIWPQSFTWQQLSARCIIGYAMLLIVPTLLLELLGVIVALSVILLSEAKRGALARPAAV